MVVVVVSKLVLVSPAVMEVVTAGVTAGFLRRKLCDIRRPMERYFGLVVSDIYAMGLSRLVKDWKAVGEKRAMVLCEMAECGANVVAGYHQQGCTRFAWLV